MVSSVCMGILLFGILVYDIGCDARYQHTAVRVAVSRPAKGGGLRAPLRRQLACSCQGNTCGCCAQVNLQQLAFNKPVCLNFTYNPEELSITITVLLDDQVIYETGVSGRNPPPLCIPVPQLPIVSICVRFYDIQQVNQNVKACINLEVQVQRNPVLVFALDCVQVGANGISVVSRPNLQMEPSEMYDIVEDRKACSPGSFMVK